MEKQGQSNLVRRMTGPLAVAFFLGCGGLIAGPLIRLINAAVSADATATDRARAFAVSDLDVAVALVFGLVGVLISFIQAAREVVTALERQATELSVLQTVTNDFGRTIAPGIGPMLSDPSTATLAASIIDEIGAFYKKIAPFDPRTKRACLEVVRDTLDDMDNLLRSERGAYLTASQCTGLYRMLATGGTEFTYIERKPLTHTRHYSPNFVQFLEQLRNQNPKMRMRYILCCSSEDLENGVPFPNSSESREVNSGYYDALSLSNFLKGLGIEAHFISEEQLSFVGLSNAHSDMFHFHFGTSVFCSVRPPSTGHFRDQAFRFNIWSEASEPEIARWVNECKALAVTSVDMAFLQSRGIVITPELGPG